ncbi:MAG: hypothetical protein Q8P67_26210 [archaeon]|nr:hypothetical protein [archaeon]
MSRQSRGSRGGGKSFGRQQAKPPASPLHTTEGLPSQSSASPSTGVAPFSVSLNTLVAVQIVKHAKDNLPSQVTGQLLGLEENNRVDVTYSFPLLKPAAPSSYSYLASEREEAAEKAAESATEHQVQMLRRLRRVNVDNNLVGWYQTTRLGTLINDQLIETQYSYQSSLPHSVCLTYDPLKTTQGALCLKAYRLSDAFMRFFAEGSFTSDKLLEYRVSHSRVLEEVPLLIQNSSLLEGLLAELSCGDHLPSHPRLDLPQATYMEKTLEQMIDYTDELIHDLTHHQFWQRKRNLQLQLQTKRLHQRRELNADRAASGLAPLPEEPETSKYLPEPPRLEAILLSAQIEQYSSHLNTFAGHAFGKLFLLEGLQGESFTLAAPSSSYASHAQLATHSE